jgi:hypothetical protein
MYASLLILLVKTIKYGYANFGRVPYGSILVITILIFRVEESFTSPKNTPSAPEMKALFLIMKVIQITISAQ